jgi:hypothetical protein
MLPLRVDMVVRSISVVFINFSGDILPKEWESIQVYVTAESGQVCEGRLNGLESNKR